MSQLIKPFIVSIMISFFLTPIVIRSARRFGYIDVPKDDRRVHKHPMPLAGGVAIYLAVILTLITNMKHGAELNGLVIGSTIIVLSGLIDDKKGLSPKMKILFQLIAAMILVLAGVRIEFFTNFLSFGESVIFLEFFAIPITIFWIVGITNTVNLIDGLDGLAAGVSAICSISLMFIAYRYGYSDTALIATVLAGSCIGFLPFNFNPARIFMGDTGALFLGFILSYISIQGVMKSAAALTIFVPVLILGVPVFDTTFAMIRRKLSGKSMVEADKGHLHHRLLKLGLSQKQAVLVLYGISFVFGVLANVISEIPNQKTAFIVSFLIVVAILLIAALFGMFKSREE